MIVRLRSRLLSGSLALLIASVSILALSGCAAITAPTLSSAGAGEPGAAASHRSGAVIGGQNPIAGASLSVWVAGSNGYGTGATQLGPSFTTTAAGNFTLPAITCPAGNPPMYILASGGNPGVAGNIANSNIMLGAALGLCSSVGSSYIVVNEVTTAALGYAMSHFFTSSLGVGSADGFGGLALGASANSGLVAANLYTVPLLVNPATGVANVTSTVGGLTTTLESAKLNSIANILAACVNSTGQTDTSDTSSNCGRLFSNTLRPGGARPADTLQAAVEMALYPSQNAAALFSIISGTAAPFSGLSVAPNDWSLAVSYTSSTYGLGIDGTASGQTSSNLDIDEAGNVWFPTNTATTHGLGEFMPSIANFAPVVATALVHPQYVAITRQGLVYASDTRGQALVQANGTRLAVSGATGPLAASANANGGPDNILFTVGNTAYQAIGSQISQSMVFNNMPNAMVAYGGSSSIDAATSTTICTLESSSYGTVASTGSSCIAGGIALTSFGNDDLMTGTNNQVCNFSGGTGKQSGTCFMPPLAVNNAKGVAVDGDDQVWIANAGNASLTTFGDTYSNGANKASPINYVLTSSAQYLHDSNNGGTMTAPYGLAIDRSGNVWVSNAGCVSTNGAACVPTPFVLSELIGAAYPTVTPLALQNATLITGNAPRSNSVAGSAAGH